MEAIKERRNWFKSLFNTVKSVYIETWIAAFFINLLALALPLYVMNTYDRVIPHHANDTLIALTVGIVIVIVFDFILRFLRTHFLENCARYIDTSVFDSLISQLMRIPLKDQLKSVGRNAHVIEQFNKVREFLSSASISLLIDCPFVFVFIGIMAWLGGILFLVPFVISILLLISTFFLRRISEADMKKLMQLDAKKQVAFFELIIGLTTIKTQSAYSDVENSWSDKIKEHADVQFSFRKKLSLHTQLVSICTLLGSVLVVFFGVLGVVNGHITLGAVIASMILSTRIISPIGQIANLWMRLTQVKDAYKCVDNVMQLDTESQICTQAGKVEKLLGKFSFEEVTFSYPGSKIPIFENFKFTIKPGEHLGLVGRVGAGKSSFIKLLMGLYNPLSGKVMVDKLQMSHLDLDSFRSKIAFIGDDQYLFDGTLRQNILFGKNNVSNQELMQKFQKLGLDALVGQFHEGLETNLGEGGQFISCGQRRIVAFFQAILKNPDVYILDEPCVSMDEASERLIVNCLNNFAKGKTLILATHKSSMLSLVDNLLVLDKGKPVAYGPKSDVLAKLNQSQKDKQGGKK